jgi:hypothetical protein
MRQDPDSWPFTLPSTKYLQNNIERFPVISHPVIAGNRVPRINQDNVRPKLVEVTT